MKVLVVEDETDIRNNLCTVLRMEGYQVLDAPNGKAGLDQALLHLPDLIVSDVMMPELDGYGMLERLRNVAATACIPFIFLTARADRVDMRRGMTLGADDYLAKPFTVQELLEAIAATFKRHNTHENKALKQTLSALEDVGRLAQHDLKTPLGSLAAAPALLRAGRTMSAQEESVLRMMELAANRAMHMVNLSLDIYRMETGDYVFKPTAVSLCDIAQAVAQDLTAQASSKQVQIKITAQSLPTYVQAEDALCYSIVANLTKNAIEAAPDGTVVSMDIEGGPRARLHIHNQGAVPEGIRDTFFAKYASAGKKGGSGLGTYSAHLLAQAQGGSLHMETSDGMGTRLTLELQAMDAPTPEQSRPDAKPDTSAAAIAAHVLLVDDDAFNLMVLSDHFSLPGVSITTAINGRAAIEAVAQHQPDIIVMDLEMPVMNGTAAMQEIRRLQAALGRKPSTMVAYSGNNDDASQTHQRAQGFDRCLCKPATRDQVHALLSNPQILG